MYEINPGTQTLVEEFRSKRPSPYAPDICIYHDKCNDGFGAAWAVRKAWPDVQIEFVPCNYGQDLPDLDYAGKNVLVVDFSFPADTLSRLGNMSASAVVLDHHVSAMDELREFGSTPGMTFKDVPYMPAVDNVIVAFDMERSGARMAWDFCFPAVPPPRLILHVEDRDLWQFKYSETKAIHLMLTTVPYDFDAWDKTIEQFESDYEGFMSRADAVARYHDARVSDIVSTHVTQAFHGYEGVPVVHCPYAFVSDVCHAMLHLPEHGEAPFAVAVVDAYGKRTYSLRSLGKVDVSRVARENGGGGHARAAGFRESVDG